MAISQSGLLDSFNINKYRRQGRLYTVSIDIDLNPGQQINLEFQTATEILVVSRDFNMVRGSIEYKAYLDSTFGLRGSPVTIRPVDFSMGKPNLASMFLNSTVITQGTNIVRDLVRVSSQTVTASSIIRQEDTTRFYPAGTFLLNIRNNSNIVGNNVKAYGMLTLTFGELVQNPNS
jgi:hypothetical protein